MSEKINDGNIPSINPLIEMLKQIGPSHDGAIERDVMAIFDCLTEENAALKREVKLLRQPSYGKHLPEIFNDLKSALQENAELKDRLSAKEVKVTVRDANIDTDSKKISALKARLAAYEEGIAVEDADNKTAYMFMSNRGLRYAFYSYNIHNPTNWSYYEEDGICFIPEDARLYPLPLQKEKSE